MAKRDTEALRYLLDYCNGDRQREKVRVYIEQGTYERAGKVLKCHTRNIQRAVQHAKARATMMTPHPPLGQPARDGEIIRKTSTYYDKEGKPTGQWVIKSLDDERRAELMREMVAGLTDDLPRYSPIKAPKLKAPDLLNLYTLTDCHVGMRAWAKEGGAEWDLAEAERVLVSAAIEMMEASPAADTCVVAELGDWMHYDGHHAKTPVHGHLLDASGRPSEMMYSAVRILRRVVDAALHKHRKVILLAAEGNHDMRSSDWIRAMLTAVYEREPRLEVIQEQSPFYAYQHGSVMLGWHHGHTKGHADLPLLFATQYAPMWGLTTYREIHTGHHHHRHIKEYSGATVHQHSTLAARDHYASSNGYHSHRQAEAITYHSKYGRVATRVVTPEMLREAA